MLDLNARAKINITNDLLNEISINGTYDTLKCYTSNPKIILADILDIIDYRLNQIEQRLNQMEINYDN